MRPTIPLLAVLALALSACGGGGGGSSSSTGGDGATPARTAVGFRLGWGGRSRAIVGPGSALSARLSLTDPTTGTEALAQKEDRRGDPTAYEADYATDGKVAPGPYTLAATFYSEAGGKGVVVARGSADVVVAKDGSGVGTVATVGEVRSVSVGRQSVVLGAAGALALTVRDGRGAVLALSPGSATWTQTGGDAAAVGADGAVATRALGAVAAKATVDGVASDPAVVAIVPASVSVEGGQIVPYGETKRLACTAKDANGREVAVPEGLAEWQKTGDGGFFALSADGLATAAHAGSEGVRVLVLGVTSGPAVVTVSAAPIVSLSVAAGQTLRLREIKKLAFSAKDADGKDVASLASASWSVVSGDAFLALSSDGSATGREAGVASVRLAVGAVTSDPATVEVLNTATVGFVNPSFESDLSGWATNGSVQAYWGGRDGSRHVWLGGRSELGDHLFFPGGVSQTVPGLTPGARYRVTYWINRNHPLGFAITANGKKISTSHFGNNQTWAQYRTDEFVADASDVTFGFQNDVTGRNAVADIDDVALEAVP